MAVITSLRKPLYTRNYASLKRYGTECVKFVRCASVRTKGIELPKGNYTPKGSVNDAKLSSNICRARSAVRELVLCNPFDLFVTVTIDPKKFDRYDLPKFRAAFAQWIRDFNKKHGLQIKYVFIPETHKNGAWHMHGFIMGLPLSMLQPFTLDMRLPKYIRKKLQQGEAIYNWQDYQEKFGFVDIELVRSRERAASYVTKYITKDLARSVTAVGAHLYYASQGLSRAELLKRGTSCCDDLAADYENKYCKVNWFDLSKNTTDELKALIISNVEQRKGERYEYSDSDT